MRSALRIRIHFVAAICCLLAASRLQGEESGLYIKVQLQKALKVSALQPGDIVSGKLASAVYSREREVFPSGSPIHLRVATLERRRRPANDHWPWVVQFFTPRYEKYPGFRSATVSLPNGAEVPLQTSTVFFN